MQRTLADIKAEQDALAKEAAALEKPALEEAQKFLNSDAVKGVFAKIALMASALPNSQTAQNLNGIGVCYNAAVQTAALDINNVTARLSTPTGPGIVPGLPGGQPMQ